MSEEKYKINRKMFDIGRFDAYMEDKDIVDQSMTKPNWENCPNCKPPGKYGTKTYCNNHWGEPNWEIEFVEKGADLEHRRWAGWQKHMFLKCEKNDDGTLTIPRWAVERWFSQLNTPYSMLTEEEKESDRRETRNYLPLVSQTLKQEKKELTDRIRKRLDYCKEQNGLPHCKNCGLNESDL